MPARELTAFAIHPEPSRSVTVHLYDLLLAYNQQSVEGCSEQRPVDWLYSVIISQLSREYHLYGDRGHGEAELLAHALSCYLEHFFLNGPDQTTFPTATKAWTTDQEASSAILAFDRKYLRRT